MQPDKYLAVGSPGIPMLYEIETDKYRKVTQADWDRLVQRTRKLETAFQVAVEALKK